MAINASKITATDSLNQLREEFNQLISDVENLEKGIAVFNSFSANTAKVHQFETNEGITYNPPTASGTLVVASELAGNVAGQITLADESSDTENFITFANAATGGQALKTGTNLTFNANTGLLSTSLLSTTSLSISDGGNIGSASATNALTIASDGVVTLVDDLVIKNGGTIGSSSANDAMTIASSGIVTFKDDILIKDSGTIGSASATSAITIASDGVVTLVDDLVIKDSGTIGSASDPDSIEIDSSGNVNITQGRDGLKLNGTEIFKLIYPVGSIYISATLATASDVAAAFGGTWVAFGAGKVMVGLDSGDTDFDESEKTDGSKTNTLAINQIPEHAHHVANTSQTGSGASTLESTNHLSRFRSGGENPEYGFRGTATAPTVGLSSMNLFDVNDVQQSAETTTSVTNLQPYIVVYMYRRTDL